MSEEEIYEEKHRIYRESLLARIEGLLEILSYHLYQAENALQCNLKAEAENSIKAANKTYEKVIKTLDDLKALEG